jgi:hypothetical protein
MTEANRAPNILPVAFVLGVLLSISYFAFLFFPRSGRVAFHLRYLIIGLVAVSVVINSLTTVSWLLEADMNVPAETRAKWNQFLGRTLRR